MMKKYSKEVSYDTAFEWLQDIMTPYEINELGRRGWVFLDLINKIKYNQKPKKKRRRKKRQRKNEMRIKGGELATSHSCSVCSEIPLVTQTIQNCTNLVQSSPDQVGRD
jgi:hypothetical protein